MFNTFVVKEDVPGKIVLKMAPPSIWTNFLSAQCYPPSLAQSCFSSVSTHWELTPDLQHSPLNRVNHPVVLECIARDFLQVDVEQQWGKLSSLAYTYRHGKELAHVVIEEYWAPGVVVQCLDGGTRPSSTQRAMDILYILHTIIHISIEVQPDARHTVKCECEQVSYFVCINTRPDVTYAPGDRLSRRFNFMIINCS